MKTLDKTYFQEAVSDLDGRVSSCDNGEGNVCSTLDGKLLQYAQFCDELRAKITEWANAVFQGKIEFDGEFEGELRRKGIDLIDKSRSLLLNSQTPSFDRCFVLAGQPVLHQSLHSLEKLIFGWVSPRLAVSPSARVGLILDDTIRVKLDGLPRLPRDWEPSLKGLANNR